MADTTVDIPLHDPKMDFVSSTVIFYILLLWIYFSFSREPYVPAHLWHTIVGGTDSAKPYRGSLHSPLSFCSVSFWCDFSQFPATSSVAFLHSWKSEPNVEVFGRKGGFPYLHSDVKGYGWLLEVDDADEDSNKPLLFLLHTSSDLQGGAGCRFERHLLQDPMCPAPTSKFWAPASNSAR